MATALVRNADVRSFIVRLMVRAGTNQTEAIDLAKVLVDADYRGHFSHGINRLEMYFNDVRVGATASGGEPVILNSKGATAWVDGSNLLGSTVSSFAMNLAIEKAKEYGIGWVTCKGSNHFSIAGHWAMMAEEQGLLGMAFTNTSPMVIPTRGAKPTYGTNPISLAAPSTTKDDSFVLDMATTTVALGKVELARRKGESIPDGWAADHEGRVTNTPADCLNGGGLMPLGGSEQNGGYKGYGLGMMVEIFCGILSGSHYSTNVRRWGATDRVADLGQCFVAIDPAQFAPGFAERLADLNKMHRELPTAPDAPGPVKVPGDPERDHMAKCEEMGGIPYHVNIVAHVNKIAAEYGVETMPFTEL